MSQSDCPAISLQSALKIAQALWDNFAGKSATPINVANALELMPSSGGWRELGGASIAYGLTDGGYNATQISLLPLGKRIVAPTIEGDDAKARIEAALKPRVAGAFFQKYDGAKFPKDSIAEAVLVEMGIPRERAARTINVLRENAKFSGIITEIKGEQYVSIASAASAALPSLSRQSNEQEFQTPSHEDNIQEVDELPPALAAKLTTFREAPKATGPRKVFITHGSNKTMLEAIKEIVTYGKFEPVVSVQRESVAKPVPQKVMDEMSACDAGVIHVATEKRFFDEDGQQVETINENVLIEIGAAMALYKRNFILLVPESVSLPSNLQGLYECRYQGDALDAASTMKLLKAFNDFKFEE
jgi:predicted nucleotide-binding protein